VKVDPVHHGHIEAPCGKLPGIFDPQGSSIIVILTGRNQKAEAKRRFTQSNKERKGHLRNWLKTMTWSFFASLPPQCGRILAIARTSSCHFEKNMIR
jgi:hypothetical protein